jgi:hypothetical protein
MILWFLQNEVEGIIRDIEKKAVERGSFWLQDGMSSILLQARGTLTF